jgi:hypothetical protein
MLMPWELRLSSPSAGGSKALRIFVALSPLPALRTTLTVVSPLTGSPVHSLIPALGVSPRALTREAFNAPA